MLTLRPEESDEVNNYLSGGGAARAEDAQRTRTQSHITPRIIGFEDKIGVLESDRTGLQGGPCAALLRVDCQTILELTCFVCGTTPSTMERGRARAPQIGGHEWTEASAAVLAALAALAVVPQASAFDPGSAFLPKSGLSLRTAVVPAPANNLPDFLPISSRSQRASHRYCSAVQKQF